MVAKGDYLAASALSQKAIEAAPNFAMAYASLGTTYHNLGENSLAAENTNKAFELRQRVSEREKYYIESHYYHFVTGNLDEARKVYELWAQTYPRDVVPTANLGVLHQNLGQYDMALEEFHEALRLVPDDALTYSNLVISYICLNRLKEAAATAEKAQAENLDSAGIAPVFVRAGCSATRYGADGAARHVGNGQAGTGDSPAVLRGRNRRLFWPAQ